jgi:GGDEF domain-containing protein
MTRVGLVHLTPEQLELLSALADRPEFEVVGAVHPDADSTPYKIAQILAVPTDTHLEALRGFAPELVVVPEETDDLRHKIRALGLSLEVLTTREMASRYDLPIKLCRAPAHSPGPSSALRPANGPEPPRIAAESGSVTARREDGRRPAPAPPSAAPLGSASPAPSPATPAPAPPPPLTPTSSTSPPLPGVPAAVARSIPNLEIMLRDGLDDLLSGDGELAQRLERLTAAWAELLGAEACAVLIDDTEHLRDGGWVVGGPGAHLAPAPDPVTRNVLDGVPHVYVRHESPAAEGEAAGPHPRQAIAAFPLEAVRGVLWFLNLRLPAQEVDERLMVLRRSARRLGRVLALSGQVVELAREQAGAVRVADFVARMAAASQRQEVEEHLRTAIAIELHPELTVLRLPGNGEPEISNNLPARLNEDIDLLLAAEKELSNSARAALSSKRQPSMRMGERSVSGLAVPIRRGNEVLGSISIFRSANSPGAEVDQWTERERRLLERLALHAAGALALTHTGEAVHVAVGEVLDRRGLLALLRTEVRRAERYSIPFLLTVFELDDTPSTLSPGEELIQAFARNLRPRLRGLDAVARVGKNRFAVLNPHTDRAGGRVVMRAREALADLEKDYPGASALDVRGNQVVFPGDVATLDELLARLG